MKVDFYEQNNYGDSIRTVKWPDKTTLPAAGDLILLRLPEGKSGPRDMYKVVCRRFEINDETGIIHTAVILETP